MNDTQRKGLGGFDKVLIGCGIGCAALILLVVLGVSFGTMWFFTPGEQVATEAIADDSSLGVVRLHELADDPGTQQLLTRVLERIDEAGREQQREELPPSLRWISDFQAQQSDAAGVNMLIPKEMTIVYEEAEDGSGVDFVVAANPRTMVRMFKTMLSLISRGDETGEVRSDYRQHSAYALEADAHLAFVRSTLLFASSRRALERAIDRIESPSGEDAASAPAAAFELAASIPPGAWDVEGTLSNEAGLVDGLLEDLTGPEDESPEEPGSGMGGEDLTLGFGFDVVSADEISGRAVLECADRQAAERWRAVLERRYRELLGEASERGLELQLETRVEGHRVLTEIQLRGLDDLIAEALTGPEEPPEAAEAEE